jgi:hypothetical protein
MFGKTAIRLIGLKITIIVICVTVCVLAVVFIMNKTIDASGGILDKSSELLKGMFGTTVHEHQIVLNTIGEIRKHSKLVVMSTEINVDVERSSTKKFMWDYYDLGTTTVRMKVTGNKVQYYIPTDSLSEKSLKWDEEKHELVFNLPDPVLDEDIVEVQSDPGKIFIEKEIGWARLESGSGKALEDQIRRELRRKVIEAGRHELLLERAKVNAEKAVRELFDRIKSKPDIEV